MIMKLKGFIFTAVAAVMAFAACEKKQENLGAANISISTSEMVFGSEADDQTLELTATRDWKVECDADWVSVNPASGEASADKQIVTVSVLSNNKTDRTASVKFTIGNKSRALTVKQAGLEGSADALIVYSNNFDKSGAVKDGTYWPYPDQTECWKNQTGSGIAGVGFGAKNITVRNNLNSNTYSTASGTNNIFFGNAGNYFMITDIALPSVKDYTLSFGTIRNQYDAEDNTFVNSEFHVWLSADGSKWVEIEYAFEGGPKNDTWDLASSSFSLPAETAKLYIAFTSDLASSHRLDDLSLVISEGGTSIDFTSGVEKDFNATTGGGNTGGDTPVAGQPESLTKATIKEFLDAAVSTTVWYELTGEIISIAKADYGNFTIKDATDEVYIYGMTSKWVGKNDKSFSQIGLKVGDTVTLGTLRGEYNGTPQGGGNPVPAYYISHVEGEGGDEPVTPPSGEVGEYDSEISWTLGPNSYDNTSSANSAQKATVNGVIVSNLLKFGKGSDASKAAAGSATLHIPAGTSKIGFYAIAWKGKDVPIRLSSNGTEITTITAKANDGATGNPSYTITVADSDYYEVEIASSTAVTDVIIETYDTANLKHRAIVFAVKAITE